jgi:hypothetical protein
VRKFDFEDSGLKKAIVVRHLALINRLFLHPQPKSPLKLSNGSWIILRPRLSIQEWGVGLIRRKVVHHTDGGPDPKPNIESSQGVWMRSPVADLVNDAENGAYSV